MTVMINKEGNVGFTTDKPNKGNVNNNLMVPCLRSLLEAERALRSL